MEHTAESLRNLAREVSEALYEEKVVAPASEGAALLRRVRRVLLDMADYFEAVAVEEEDHDTPDDPDDDDDPDES